jgi:hypothetical protein
MAASINANQPADTPPLGGKTIPHGAATSVWAGIVADPDLVGTQTAKIAAWPRS